MLILIGTATIAYNTQISTSIHVTKLLVPLKPVVPIKNSKGTLIPNSKNLLIWKEKETEEVKDKSSQGVDGSYNPFATNVDSGSISLEAHLSADKDVDKIPFRLTGKFGGKEVFKHDKECFQGKSVTVKWESPTKKKLGIPWGRAVDIEWYLTCIPTKQEIGSSKKTSRVEAYGVSGSLPSFFQKKGVSVRFLRRFALPDFEDYTKWVTSKCFEIGFKYDCNIGYPAFGTGDSSGGTYKLQNWLDEAPKPVSRVNCYDQAGIVHLAMMLQLGNPSKPWAYMNPFGYINKVPLVGWGECNNPFFEDDTSRQVVDINDAKRTGFNNHAFIVLSDKVLDSCCGPHQGTESKSEYISAAIDKVTTLKKCEAGKKITLKDGITDIDKTSANSAKSAKSAKSALAMIAPPRLNEAIDRAMDKAIVVNRPPVEASNADFGAIPLLFQQQFGARLEIETVVIDAEGSDSRYIFDIDGGGFTLDISVCKDHETAIRVMTEHLAGYTAPLDETLSRPLTGQEKGQLNLEGPGISVWIRGNVFFVLNIPSLGLESHILAKAVDDHFAVASVPSPGASLKPSLRELRGPKEPIEVGTEFTIQAEVGAKFCSIIILF